MCDKYKYKYNYKYNKIVGEANHNYEVLKKRSKKEKQTLKSENKTLMERWLGAKKLLENVSKRKIGGHVKGISANTTKLLNNVKSAGSMLPQNVSSRRLKGLGLLTKDNTMHEENESQDTENEEEGGQSIQQNTNKNETTKQPQLQTTQT